MPKVLPGGKEVFLLIEDVISEYGNW